MYLCVWKVIGCMFSAESDKEAFAFQAAAARQPGGQNHVSLEVFNSFRGHQFRWRTGVVCNVPTQLTDERLQSQYIYATFTRWASSPS